MSGERVRVYEVVEPMKTCNIFLVAASSREDAEQRVRDDDETAIISRRCGEVWPSRHKWTVRWLRGWKP